MLGARKRIRSRALRRTSSATTPTGLLRKLRPSFEDADTVISIAANISVIFALGVALKTYLAQTEQSEREAAFEFVSSLNSGDMLGVQRRFSLEFQKLPLGQLRGVALPRETMGTLVAQLVDQSADPEALREDIITLVSYLDDAQICIESGNCDGTVIRSHIGEAAKRYACILIPYVSEIQKDLLLDGLGDGLQRMADYEHNC